MLEGLGAIGKGILGIFADGAATSLVRVGQVTNQVVNTVTSPWFWIGIAAAAGVAFYTVYKIESSTLTTVLGRKPAPPALKPATQRR